LKGKYPKSFKFTGWHPACRCHAVSILKTPEELAQENEAILAGKEPDKSSANEINDVPENFKKWVANNEARIAKAKKQGTLPYFIKDNYKDGSVDSGFSWSSEKRVKSNAEKADIQKQPDAKKNTNLSYQVKKLTNKGEYNMIVDGIISPASINETFLTLLDDSVAINVVNKPNSGSYWMSRNKSITLDNVRRRVSSEWFNKSLVYHEGGHSIADMRNLFQTKEFNDMVIKHANLMKGGNGKLIHDRIIRLHTKINSMRDDVFIKRNITKDDVKEQILGVADTLAALTKGKYGWGHKKRYFSTQSNRNHEYIAHAFENYFAGNTVFKKIMPEIHEDMIKYIKSLISQ
jgi:hypothetical protein